jgi:hypothetical protein
MLGVVTPFVEHFIGVEVAIGGGGGGGGAVVIMGVGVMGGIVLGKEGTMYIVV